VLARKTLDLGHSLVKAGVTTDYIDEVVHNFIIENNAYPSPLNYYKFPKSLCTSVNEVICHGIPDSRPLENGDIVNLDVTVFKDGVHVDLNETYLVGEVAESSKFLVSKAYECLQKAIEVCKPGTMYREVGNVISKYIEDHGYSARDAGYQ
jgi:methionyl aminopeptidase